MFAFSAFRDMLRIGRVLTVSVYARLTRCLADCVLSVLSAGFLSGFLSPCDCCEKAATVHTRSTKAANRFLTCARCTTGFKSVFFLDLRVEHMSVGRLNPLLIAVKASTCEK